MDSSNLDIFVCGHRKFDLPVSNDVYKILSLGNNIELYGENIYREDCGNNVSFMNGFYSELSGYYWVWKNYDIKDYIGFCHYRRYFAFMDDIIDIGDYDIILPQKLDMGISVYASYGFYHNIKDFDIIISILLEDYGISMDIISSILFSGTKLYCCNMFITSKEIFNEYCEFFFGIMYKYLDIKGISNMDDVYKMVEDDGINYLKSYYPNNTVKYQSRIGGALCERLLTLFVIWKGLRVKEVPMLITEDKYNEIKDNDFI